MQGFDGVETGTPGLGAIDALATLRSIAERGTVGLKHFASDIGSCWAAPEPAPA